MSEIRTSSPYWHTTEDRSRHIVDLQTADYFIAKEKSYIIKNKFLKAKWLSPGRPELGFWYFSELTAASFLKKMNAMKKYIGSNIATVWLQNVHERSWRSWWHYASFSAVRRAVNFRSGHESEVCLELHLLWSFSWHHHWTWMTGWTFSLEWGTWVLTWGFFVFNIQCK